MPPSSEQHLIEYKRHLRLACFDLVKGGVDKATDRRREFVEALTPHICVEGRGNELDAFYPFFLQEMTHVPDLKMQKYLGSPIIILATPGHSIHMTALLT